MKILFLNPPFTRYGGIKGYGGKTLPLNLAYLAAYLLDKGYHDVQILDSEVREMSYRDIVKKVRRINPDVLAMTAPTPSYQQVEDLSKIFKKLKPSMKIVAGGPHPSALPERTLLESEIDFLIIGEGEQTMHELVKMLDKERKQFRMIDGLAFKEKGRVIINKPRELIKDLDSIPFPARHLLEKEDYYIPPTRRVSNKKGTTMITSRGCPFDCSYCISQMIWGRGVRFRTAKNVVDEIEECVRAGYGEFNFHDDLFTASEKRVIEICDEIKRRKLKIGWACQARVDRVTEKMVRAMKSAGCGKISFGFESGSLKILKKMNKRITPQMGLRAVKIVKKVGIRTSGSFMLGNIGETKKTMRQTIDFAKKLQVDTATFFQTSPYIGTRLYQESIEKGYLKKHVKWKDYALLSKNQPALDLPGLTAREVAGTIKRAYLEYYLNPVYIFNKLKSIRSTRDVINLYQGFKIFKGLT